MLNSSAAAASSQCAAAPKGVGTMGLTATWHKSTRSVQNGCVEVRLIDRNHVAVRDSKDPNGSILKFNLVEWEAFTEGVRNGEFDPSSD